tara:strand:+ start:253 stop:1086 length:834 start_codon:yes stop_codon:yes gene_type:complete
MGDIVIENHELIITDLNQLSLTHNLIVSTNGILTITDISFISIPNEYNIILKGTTSRIVFLGGVSENNDNFIANKIILQDGATYEQINSDTIPCLLGDTKIKTSRGSIKVKNLKRGDKVLTQNNREVEIVNIYCSDLKTTENNSPYLIPAHYFSRNYPKKQFMISPLHAIATNKRANEWCIPKIHCKDLKRMSLGENISYYHVELPNWLNDHLILEDGTLVESYAKTFHGDLDNVFYIRSAKTGYYKRDMEKYTKAIEIYKKLKKYKTNKARQIIFE